MKIKRVPISWGCVTNGLDGIRLPSKKRNIGVTRQELLDQTGGWVVFLIVSGLFLIALASRL